MKLGWAKRMNSVENPALDNVLAIINRPDIISFAGGLPAPDCFPVEEMAAAFAETLAEDKGSALQYGACDGFRPLKEWVATYMVERQAMASCSPDEVLITSGSQQGIELIARALLEPGDRVIVESPSYMAALQVFSNIEAVSIAAPSDEDGLITEGLAELIRKEKPKFIYVIPTFQNPSGITMTLKRRKELIKIAHEEGIPILEDNPYGELRYMGESLPPLKSLSSNPEEVLYLGTFSKIVAPGLRLGWMVTTPEVVRKLSLVKQSTDLLCNLTSQFALTRYLQSGALLPHLEKIKANYKVKRDAMEEAMKKHFPKEVHWANAEGGMFFWATLPESIDTMEMLDDALAAKVAYVPGVAFYPDGQGKSSMRLNFSNATPEKINEGITKLGEVIASRLK